VKQHLGKPLRFVQQCNIFACFVLLLFVNQVHAQTIIGGTINLYGSVTAVNTVTNAVTLSSNPGFVAGDRVLLIQMKGASINQTNSSNYGDLTALNNAGNYEIHEVCAAVGTEVTFINAIDRSYTVAGAVQLVSIPTYTDAEITSTLTASAWDGSIGGVLALEVSGTLTFSANIDVSGLGFRGGAAVTSGYSCSWFSLSSSYFYTTASGRGAPKGEGIRELVASEETGAGKLANGGGGGNDHNGGGAGGANAGAGGLGGDRVKSSTFTCGAATNSNGGLALTHSTAANRIFFGGGGGAGHGNNAGTTNESGLNGGGIVLIQAGTIAGNSNSILANGIDNAGSALNEGAGGGGGGGTVLLDVTTYSSALTVDVTGGDGGGNDGTGTSNCNGPGGGGGGGAVWFSLGSAPGSVTVSNAGGAVGTITSSSQSGCNNGDTNGATAGSAGTSVTSLVWQEAPGPAVNCLVLGQVSIHPFTARLKGRTVELNGVLSEEKAYSKLEIQRSSNAVDFSTVGVLNQVSKHFSYTDYSPQTGVVYYRAIFTDLATGETTASAIASLELLPSIELLVYPQPSKNGHPLLVSSGNNNLSGSTWKLIAPAGNTILSGVWSDESTLQLHTEKLLAGMYIFVVQPPIGNAIVKRIIIAP